MSCPHCVERAWQQMSDAELVAAVARVAGLGDVPGFDPLNDNAHCMLLLSCVVGLNLDRIVADAWKYNHQPASALRYVRRNVVRAVAKFVLMNDEQRFARGW